MIFACNLAKGDMGIKGRLIVLPLHADTILRNLAVTKDHVMEHLALEIFDRSTVKGITDVGSKYANLEPDASITLTDTSEIFEKGDVWSYSFTLNVAANAHIFGTCDDIHGSRLHEQINKRRCRLWVEGLPLFLGYLRLADEVEVDADGNVDVTFESGQKTFDDMIDGAKANQVPTMGDVQIGMALWRKRWTRFQVKLSAIVKDDSLIMLPDQIGFVGVGNVSRNGEEWFEFAYDGEEDGNSVQKYPRMVFSSGDFRSDYDTISDNFLNTDEPYSEDDKGTPSHPYCNISLCYQKSGYESKDKDGNTSINYNNEPEAQRGYEYAPANRMNSAPNFFVIYWIRALMQHLGIYIEENQMLGVEDLRRLFFVNTNCDYIEPEKLRTGSYNQRFGRYTYQGEGDLIPEYLDTKHNVDEEESGFKGINVTSSVQEFANEAYSVKIREIREWSAADKALYLHNNRFYHKAIATSNCFPNVDISDAISAIENGFGVRFLFDGSYQRVRIVLLRNVFRDQEVQDINCEVVDDDVKVENSIRGFRMTYGKKEDTHFFYKGFDDKLPKKDELWVDDTDKHDYSSWQLDARYENIINKVSAFDKTCYVTPNTGNAYGIKIDKDAKRYDELRPALFEYAGFMDAEDGDCTGEDETIETVDVGFAPAIMNDLNMDAERSGELKQQFALFVDEDMRPRRPDLKDGKDYNNGSTVYDIDKLYIFHGPNGMDNPMVTGDGIVAPGSFAIKSDMYANGTGFSVDEFIIKGSKYSYTATFRFKVSFDIEGHIYEGYRLYLQDNYEPDDDGVSPIEKKDWGLTLGIMRGSGSDAYVDYKYDPEDGEGNDTWDIVPGRSVTSHPDTCDNYGNLWNYIGGTTEVSSPEVAKDVMRAMFPQSNFDLENLNSDGYLTDIIFAHGVYDSSGNSHTLLLAHSTISGTIHESWQIYSYVEQHLNNKSVSDMYLEDKKGWNILIKVDGTSEQANTLISLQRIAFGGGTPLSIDGSSEKAVAVTEGRFSLKLRAEKLNPYYNAKMGDSILNPCYLPITNENLRRRGLADKFYKEYSYWVRNARIVRRTVHMTMAQLLSIDKTKRVRVGDVMGFIRKLQYTVRNDTGLGNVTIEIMYI